MTTPPPCAAVHGLQRGGQYSLFYFPSAGGLSGYVIRSGDKLFLTQYQTSGSKGGVVVGFTDGTNTNWNAKDNSGYYANDDQTQLATHSRTIDLSSFAGKTVNNLALNSESDTAAGAWAIIYEQLAVVSTDGTVRPLYTGQSSSPLQPGTGSSGVTGRGSTVDFNRNKAQFANTTTTYYHTDGVGTARLITQGGGWPVWQGTFAPFGQEISPQISIDNNKFATYQHENESNLEQAGFRKYSTIEGRFSSPDPYLGSADPGNPQTWNRYAYVTNNPVNGMDPSGLGGCPYQSVTDCQTWAKNQNPSAQYWGEGAGPRGAAGMTIPWTGLDLMRVTLATPVVDGGGGNTLDAILLGAYGLAANVKSFLSGGASSGHQDFGIRGLVSSGLNPTTQFVGSYNYSLSLSGPYLNITLVNSTTLWSFFYHAPVFNPNPPDRNDSVMNPSGTWHPTGRVNQTFHLTVPCE